MIASLGNYEICKAGLKLSTVVGLFFRVPRPCQFCQTIAHIHTRHERMPLLHHSRHYHQRFAEVGVGLSRCMRQRNEHLAAAQLRRTHLVLHDRVAGSETVLCLQPLEDPLRAVPLLRRSLLSSSRMASMTPTMAQAWAA